MKTTAEKVRAQLNKLSAAQDDIARCQESLSTCQAKLAALTIEGDLEDGKIISAIMRNQVLASFLPARVAAREEAAALIRTDLNRTVGEFIMETFGPRKRELQQMIAGKVRAALAPMFAPNHDLSQAVLNSSLMQEWFALDAASSLRGGQEADAAEYARQTLLAWDQFEALAVRVATA